MWTAAMKPSASAWPAVRGYEPPEPQSQPGGRRRAAMGVGGARALAAWSAWRDDHLAERMGRASRGNPRRRRSTALQKIGVAMSCLGSCDPRSCGAVDSHSGDVIPKGDADAGRRDCMGETGGLLRVALGEVRAGKHMQLMNNSTPNARSLPEPHDCLCWGRIFAEACNFCLQNSTRRSLL
jgi:hypothetical protein